ncbi:G-patch domain containing 3 L homeolog [Xenopus laevis]|uniref:G-patch domain containing 3 L homeolog n=1 Tax=Xenopus laevis TaxID=8355 RepID=Q6DEE9_XENLA|nr:G-patch domain containing 3 L homeolog [Xenopus laevis]AAH77171.1 MGC78780 protein [Xenopus laevis]
MADLSGSPVVFVVCGIPRSFRSAQLRHYFSQFTESDGFVCFHFRHRPERRGESSATCCCPVTVKPERAQSFLQMYNMKPWLEKDGNQIPGTCLVRKVRVGPMEDTRDFPYKKRKELLVAREPGEKEEQLVTAAELNRMSEMNPPAMMPQGNVGTPLKVFLQLIRSCRLPPKVITKLGLCFPSNGRHYAKVPFSYLGTETIECQGGVYTASGQEITECVIGKESEKRPGKEQEELSHSDDDNDNCEEWERHEALHEDVTTQDRIKERLYEEHIELKWEKGGSGLVFYTDAQVWQGQEGDFDEQTADDWDVDMSAYYEADGGDKDARDSLKMRLEARRRDGLGTADAEYSVGGFEKHTKGFGRKVMKRQGWTEGSGLGANGVGMPEALENEGQNPKCKRGLGYHGEKLQTFGPPKKKQTHFISTVYDQPRDEDMGDTLLRRQPHTAMKYREGKR